MAISRRFAPVDALGIQHREGCRFADNASCHGDGVGKLLVREMPDRWTSDDCVPRRTERRVETDAHEAMIFCHRPWLGSGHFGKNVTHESMPLRNKHVAGLSVIASERQLRLLL
ncbi:MAG: hypothetical protein ACRCUE_16270 [Bosea sp. (in: a-proteobacteria)]